MSRETSEASGKTYGLERVCRVLEFPRSTSYAQRQAAKVVALDPARRGPKPKVSELDLLAAIRVSRARVLRLMRENQLLSPHRRPQGGPVLHDGTITTDRPNEMWGTDGIRIETVDEGWVWVFSAVASGHPSKPVRLTPCKR